MNGAHAILLNPSFRFVHEPLDCSADAHLQRFVGRQDELDELVGRILLSDGGALLVTGYRGVGKSTFVNRVITELKDRLPQLEAVVGRTELLAVRLNVPRAMTSLELMYHVLRGLYLGLEERELLPMLPPRLREDLRLAFARTSQEIGLKTTSAIERTTGVKFALPLPQIAESIGSISLDSKRASSSAREISYLAYDDKAAEYDLVSIAHRLVEGYVPRETPFEQLRRRMRRQPPPRVRLKVLFVFDELDKLEAPTDPTGSIDKILGNLKTLFTTSGISFLFVAGKDTHERWLEDIGRGDSIYESVFSYARYLPPMWTDADPMCDPFLAPAAFRGVDAGELASAYAAFKKFLAFNGRGIARRILRKYNERVRWNASGPVLTFSRDDVRQFKFFADLYDLLRSSEPQLIGELREEADTGRIDRQRLGIYYLIDWILLRGFEEFTLSDAVAASKRLSRLIAPADEAAPALIRRLLDMLVKHAYIEVVQPPRLPAGATPAGASLSPPPVRYRLLQKRLVEMGSITAVVEPEAQAVSTESLAERFAPRYHVVSTLGRGGMGTVYLADDLQLQRQVAIKELIPELAAQADVRQRFRREVEILARFQHDNVVRILDWAENPDRCYLVMEYIEGVPLADLIAARGRIAETDALHIAQELARALEYVHGRGVRWGDPKPANAMVTPAGRVVLLDFGVAHLAGTAGDPTQLQGTPSYMAPEQLRGESVDERSDLYSLGAVLYQMLTGRAPFEGGLEARLLNPDARPEPPSHVAATSQPLSDVVMRCLAPDPERRFASAAQLVMALRELEATATTTTPEIPQELLRRDVESRSFDEFTVSLQRPIQALPRAQFRKRSTITPPRVPQPAVDASGLAADTAPRILLPDGTSCRLTPPRVRIGRDASNEIVLDEPAASRYHAELQQTRDGWTLADQNTRNGTSVNGTPATAPVILRSGDEIRIGLTVMRYVTDASDPGTGTSAARVRFDDVAEFVERLRELSASGQFLEACHAALDAAIDLTRAERAFILQAVDGDRFVFRAGRARGGITLPGEEFDVSRKLVTRALHEGEPQYALDLLAPDTHSQHQETVALGIRQVVAVPLRREGAKRAAGVLYLDTREKADFVSDRMRSALRILSAELLDVLDRPVGAVIARVVPADDLPAGPAAVHVMPELDFGGGFYMVSIRQKRSTVAGGDFHVRLSVADASRLAMAIGDVAGRGAKAAALADFVARVLSAAPDQALDARISGANKALREQGRAEQFATVLGFELSESGMLSYVNAGSPIPYTVRGREVGTLDASTLPIGIFQDADFSVEQTPLAAGDTLVVCSDGVLEALGPDGQEFGAERLRAVIAGNVDADPRSLADTIVRDLAAFSGGGRLHDDVTVMVMRYTGAPGASPAG